MRFVSAMAEECGLGHINIREWISAVRTARPLGGGGARPGGPHAPVRLSACIPRYTAPPGRRWRSGRPSWRSLRAARCASSRARAGSPRFWLGLRISPPGAGASIEMLTLRLSTPEILEAIYAVPHRLLRDAALFDVLFIQAGLRRLGFGFGFSWRGCVRKCRRRKQRRGSRAEPFGVAADLRDCPPVRPVRPFRRATGTARMRSWRRMAT